MKYRVKHVVEIDAMRMPLTEDQAAVREVACWMVDQGYVDPGTSINDVDADYIYDDKVLPAFGMNYLELVDGEREEEVTVHLGEWILRGITGHWFTRPDDDFRETYEECQ